MKFDHFRPNEHFKSYLDAEGKYRKFLKCKCEECGQRRGLVAANLKLKKDGQLVLGES